MVVSTKTDRNLGTINILHQGNESYENIWQKIRSVWSNVYDNYYRDFDWFHIRGDDLYLIVKNLCLYLESDVTRSAANDGNEPLHCFRHLSSLEDDSQRRVIWIIYLIQEDQDTQLIERH
jgi:hypothetical protein